MLTSSGGTMGRRRPFWEALNRCLSTIERKVLTLSLRDFSVEEIAQVLGVNPAKVREILRRAQDKMRLWLGDDYGLYLP